jgi:hypothetical protein
LLVARTSARSVEHCKDAVGASPKAVTIVTCIYVISRNGPLGVNARSCGALAKTGAGARDVKGNYVVSGGADPDCPSTRPQSAKPSIVPQGMARHVRIADRFDIANSLPDRPRF